MSVIPVDSMTVNAYTIMSPDSFSTSNDSLILVGNWTNAQTGRVTARGFTNVGYTSNSLATQQSVQFDSLVMELTYNFRYGDTTSLFDLQVHQLRQPLSSLRAYYNIDSVAYQSTPLIQQTFRPSTKTGVRQVRIRLPETIAQPFFQQLNNNTINSAETINNYWKGFAFKTTTANNIFMGFNLLSEQTGIRLYYHANDVAQTQYNVRFSLYDVHFSQLTNNISNTPLQTLVNLQDKLPSKSTGNTSIVSPGISLYTRLEIPGLSDYVRPERFVGLTRAELLLEPVRRSRRDNSPPPAQLALYQLNEINNVVTGTSQIGNSATYAASNELTELELKDYYSFDVTQYVNEVIRGQIPNRALLVTIPTAGTLRTRVRRVALGDQQNPTDRVRLRLYITTDQ